MTNLFPDSKAVVVPQRSATAIKLREVLTSWRKLSRHLKEAKDRGDPYTPRALKALIVIEHESRNRPDILKRLIARLHTTERKALFEKLKIS